MINKLAIKHEQEYKENINKVMPIYRLLWEVFELLS